MVNNLKFFFNKTFEWMISAGCARQFRQLRSVGVVSDVQNLELKFYASQMIWVSVPLPKYLLVRPWTIILF